MFFRFISVCVATVLFAINNVATYAEDNRYFDEVLEQIRSNKHIVDKSECNDIVLRTPKIAYINISGCDSLTVYRKSVKQKAWLEYIDDQGVYFKKLVQTNTQGDHSRKFPKRNFTCEFFGKDWESTENTELTFGDWVKLNTFHFKAFYTDPIRGTGEVGYKIFSDVVADRRPYWVRGGYDKESNARCFPDGFPCIVYFNDQFYGIYAWQLNKNRANMNMKKKKATHIHLDGVINDETFFQGKISWDMFCVRNPKTLYSKNNSEYDKDNPTELMDEHSRFFNVSSDANDVKEAKERSAQVKESILAFSNYTAELEQLDLQGVTKEVFRAEFEKRFDVESMLDYFLFTRLFMNTDGHHKNFQWFTYDGVKWLVAPYDLDHLFGKTMDGVYYSADFTLLDITTGPFRWLHKYYDMEERDRYYRLRNLCAFDYKSVVTKLEDWYNRVGENFYKMEREAWDESPCYCDAICYKGWAPYDDYSLYNSLEEYSSDKEYAPGDMCVKNCRIWRTSRYVQGIEPYSRNARRDSLLRLETWFEERLRIIDDFYGYKTTEATAANSLEQGADNVKGIYSITGEALPKTRKGLNVIRYKDGTSRKVFFKE